MSRHDQGPTVRRMSTVASPRIPALHEVHVRINGRYDPERVVVPAGVPLRLVFHREASDRCGERVLFPLQGEEVEVPRDGIAAVELPASEAGEYDFRCAPGDLHGTLVVEDAAALRSTAPASPWTGFAAVLLTFLLPGFGHLLIRAWTRGLVWLAGWVLVVNTSGGSAHPVALILTTVAAIDVVVYLRVSRSERT